MRAVVYQYATDDCRFEITSDLILVDGRWMLGTLDANGSIQCSNPVLTRSGKYRLTYRRSRRSMACGEIFDLAEFYNDSHQRFYGKAFVTEIKHDVVYWESMGPVSVERCDAMVSEVRIRVD